MLARSLLVLVSLAACDVEEPEVHDTDGTAADAASDIESVVIEVGDTSEEIFFAVRDGMAVFQDDIILGPVEDVREGRFVLGDYDGLSSDDPQWRSALSNGFTWPNGIVRFSISPQFAILHLANTPGALPSDPVPQVEDIRAAINHWRTQTMVRFVEVPHTSLEHHVSFEPHEDPNYCASPVGLSPGYQVIKLGVDCEVGSIIHEIGHGFGLHHEHSRNDRDLHVAINWDNIEDNLEYAYWSYSVLGQDFGLYDFNSIMHYSSFNGHSIDDGVPVMTRAGCDPNQLPLSAACEIVAQREGLSEGDKAGITRLVTGDPPLKFKLRNEATNECLVATSRNPGTAVVDGTCSNYDSRRWYTWKRPGQLGDLIINARSRLCLQRAGGGSGLIQAQCTGAANQQFFIEGTGLFKGERIRQRNTTRCVRQINAQSDPILSTTCTDDATRRWYRDWV